MGPLLLVRRRSALADRREHPTTLGLACNGNRGSRDLFLAQRFARHASPLTTVVYMRPSDEEMYEKVRDLRC